MLMTRRTEAAYQAAFEYLRDVLHIDVESIMMDFERGARNAATTVWPRATLRGCSFHYGEAVCKKVKLRSLLGRERKAAFVIRLLRRLCLVPEPQVMDGLRAIVHYIRRHGWIRIFAPYIK